jgi:DNA-binding LacI/PurR family transcriptional regulator
MSLTIRDIAKGCNVSIATVSRAMNESGYVKVAMKKQILDYARENGWRTSYVAQSLKKGENCTVALLVNSLVASLLGDLTA